MLSLMVESSVRFAAMEVSAHALALNKIEGVRFEAGIFTNLTQDHLDFFGNMENYKQAKKSFFQSSHCAVAIVNNDDSCGREIYAQKKIPSYGYGIYNPAEMFAIDIRYGCGISYTANIRDDIMQIESALYGKFNVYNTLAAASACSLCGIGREAIVKGIKNLKTVKGRFNVINVKGFKVIIDYAHTPDGIRNVLIAARELCAARLICVFGCGGNRDKSKRPIMGNIASELSDFCVITSDNPRFEDPVEIIREIEKGVIGGYICIENRKRAITYALTIAKEGDVIAILGKGAEQYQEIAGVRYPYNDYDTVKEILHI
jgi:UDP-N-acetylmuramoyl-L-alanyl-D-glutamate--2,6-diaminopimelate ligase